jgi:hypothetical protein
MTSRYGSFYCGSRRPRTRYPQPCRSCPQGVCRRRAAWTGHRAILATAGRSRCATASHTAGRAWRAGTRGPRGDTGPSARAVQPVDGVPRQKPFGRVPTLELDSASDANQRVNDARPAAIAPRHRRPDPDWSAPVGADARWLDKPRTEVSASDEHSRSTRSSTVDARRPTEKRSFCWPDA